MIRPVQFRYNEQTAVNNYYQKVLEELTPENTNQKAQVEFDSFVEKLRAKDINVIVIDDTKEPDTPDSIFPNNWVSFHENGKVGLYPMYAENRRLERRMDIIEYLKDEGFKVSGIIDFINFENENKFLESTGSMIFDRENKIQYAAISNRTHPDIVKKVGSVLGYKSVLFTANQTVEGNRRPIYHANVMMCLGDKFSVICLESIDDLTERQTVIDSFKNTGKEIIEISEKQKEHFAGNMLQLENQSAEKFMVMSSVAYSSINASQKKKLLNYNNEIIHSSLDIIEASGGGSARCMMAEVFLPRETSGFSKK